MTAVFARPDLSSGVLTKRDPEFLPKIGSELCGRGVRASAARATSRESKSQIRRAPPRLAKDRGRPYL